MRPHESPFPTGWPSIELKSFREHPPFATYTHFSFEGLPPLPTGRLDGSFHWLKQQPSREPIDDHWDQLAARQLPMVDQEATSRGFTIPESFIAFMWDRELVARVRSCACFFELPDRLFDSPRGDGGVLIHFLSDSQGCLFWYLYLSRKADHCVVASGQFFGEESVERDATKEDGIVFCSSSFEEFIYRFWIENEIWFSVSYEHRPLSEEQEEYVNHYRK